MSKKDDSFEKNLDKIKQDRYGIKSSKKDTAQPKKKKRKGPMFMAFGLAASAGMIGMGVMDSPATAPADKSTEIASTVKATKSSAADVKATSMDQKASKDFAAKAEKKATSAVDTTTTTKTTPTTYPNYNYNYGYGDYTYGDYNKYNYDYMNKNSIHYKVYGPHYHIPY